MAVHRSGVRVDQQLARVEPITVCRVPPAVHPEAVPLALGESRHETVEDVEGRLAQSDPAFGAVIVDQAEVHRLRVLGPQGDIGTLGGQGEPERLHLAGPGHGQVNWDVADRHPTSAAGVPWVLPGNKN